MAVVACAELTIEAPLPLAFQRFTDFSAWDLWMPPIFRPITGPARQLREGDKVIVALGRDGRRLRTELDIIRVRSDRELCWRAGVSGLLIGEHSFFFADQGAKTAIRSEEPLRGLLTLGPLAAVVERNITEIHRQMLAGFASHLRSEATTEHASTVAG